MKRGEERGREEKKSASREERKEKSPRPPVTHARVPESKGEGRRRERDRGNWGREGREGREERKRGRERERMKREEGGPLEMKRERMKKDVDKNVT